MCIRDSNTTGAHKSIAIHWCFTRDCSYESIKVSDVKQIKISSRSLIPQATSAMSSQQGFDHAGLALQRIGLDFALALQRPERLGHRQHVARC